MTTPTRLQKLAIERQELLGYIVGQHILPALVNLNHLTDTDYQFFIDEWNSITEKMIKELKTDERYGTP